MNREGELFEFLKKHGVLDHSIDSFFSYATIYYYRKSAGPRSVKGLKSNLENLQYIQGTVITPYVIEDSDYLDQMIADITSAYYDGLKTIEDKYPRFFVEVDLGLDLASSFPNDDLLHVRIAKLSWMIRVLAYASQLKEEIFFTVDKIRNIQEFLKRVVTGTPAHAHVSTDYYLRYTSDSLRGALRRGEVFIDYFVYQDPDSGSTRYGAAVHTADTLSVFALDETSIINELVGGFQREVSVILDNRDSDNLSVISSRLYKRLIRPLFVNLPKSITKVYISPASILWYLPFGALRDSHGDTLVENLGIHLVESGRELFPSQRTWRKTEGSLLVYGLQYMTYDEERDCSFGELVTDLAGTDLEGQLVADLLSIPAFEPVKKFSGNLVSEESFDLSWTQRKRKNDYIPPKVVHLATHGFNLHSLSAVIGSRGVGGIARINHSHILQQEESALFSGLALSGFVDTACDWGDGSLSDYTNDGWLSVAEIENFDLRGTNLVYLSACETGISNTIAPYGTPLSIGRAFRRAGAEHVIISLWSVDDIESVKVAKDFYKSLSDDKDVTEAYEEAIRSCFISVKSDAGWDKAVAWILPFQHFYSRGENSVESSLRKRK
ncbi:MAG: CHAT domain-containing protein [Verrucomicrobiota bacterium]